MCVCVRVRGMEAENGGTERERERERGKLEFGQSFWVLGSLPLPPPSMRVYDPLFYFLFFFGSEL